MSRLSEDLAASADPGTVRQQPEFSPEQRKIMLSIARDAIVSGLAGTPLSGELPIRGSVGVSWAALKEPRGVFTTLYIAGELRGCVGYATATRFLHRAIAETARAAAFEDTRFWPVTAEEVPDLKISLSVLSPLFPIKAEEVEVGRHGLLVSEGARRGLLLPQVPAEHGWDRETFLEQTCRKAGLPGNAWRESAALEAFTAEVFGDEGAPP